MANQLVVLNVYDMVSGTAGLPSARGEGGKGPGGCPPAGCPLGAAAAGRKVARGWKGRVRGQKARRCSSPARGPAPCELPGTPPAAAVLPGVRLSRHGDE